MGVAPKVAWSFSIKGFKVGKGGFRVRTSTTWKREKHWENRAGKKLLSPKSK